MPPFVAKITDWGVMVDVDMASAEDAAMFAVEQVFRVEDDFEDVSRGIEVEVMDSESKATTVVVYCEAKISFLARRK